MPNNNVTPATLRVIRSALLGGVLLFGGVIWYLHSSGSAPANTSFPGAHWIFLVVCLMAAGGVLFVRGAQARAETFASRASLAIVGWALGEGAALFGGIHWLLTGRPTLYVAGLAVFVAALTTVSASEA